MNNINVTTKVPTSKSVLARLMILGALSNEKCAFDNVSMSKDSENLLSVLKDLGFSVSFNQGTGRLKIQGNGGSIPKKEANVYVGNAGTAARFSVAMLALSDGEYMLNASHEMSLRPMKGILDTLRSAGAIIICTEKEDHFPLIIKGKRPTAPLKLKVDVSESTQFASGLMLMQGCLPEGSVIEGVNENRNSYIKLTEAVIKNFMPRMNAEGDISSAAYCYAAAMLTGGKVTVMNATLNSAQPDIKFLKLLQSFGGEFTEDERGLTLTCERPIVGAEGDLTLDMSDFSDQSMTMAILASVRKGTTTIKNIGHIRKQECDRIAALKENFDEIGIECEAGDDYIVIHGGNPHGGFIKTHNDHRIYMSFMLLSLIVDGMKADNPTCNSKSYPGFNDFMSSLRQQ